MMSFPADTANHTSLPELSFKIAGRSPAQVKVNSELVQTNGDVHTFNSSSLLTYLKVYFFMTSLFIVYIFFVKKIGHRAFGFTDLSLCKHHSYETYHHDLPVLFLISQTTLIALNFLIIIIFSLD